MCSIASLTIKVVFQIRRGYRDNFPYFSIKILYDPSLEPSYRDGFNEGPQYMLKWRDKLSQNHPQYSNLIWSSVKVSESILGSVSVAQSESGVCILNR